MAKLELLGGSYAPRSVIAGRGRCINLYPELNPKDAPFPVTHYQRPGLTPLAQGPVAPVRGLWRASNGNGYTVIGQNVYFVKPSFALQLLGQLNVASTTPVSMADNGTILVIGDATGTGYKVDLGTNVFSAIVDGTGTFLGTVKWDFMDTFLLYITTANGSFGATLSNQVVFNPLFFGAKSDWPDPIQTLIVNRHEIILLGTVKGEVWYNAGNPQFPFAELPGAYIEHGIAAIYSLASSDISSFWLAQDLQGSGMVLRQRGYETSRISNHALEFAIREMRRTSRIDDAIGYTYQQDGHLFYVLQFPSGDQTWVFDDALGGDPYSSWSQRAWSDADGVLHRDRTNCHAFLYGQNVVGDWQNGQLYALDLSNHTDAGAPIQYVRTFPHIAVGVGPNGQPMHSAGRRLQFRDFIADIGTGDAPLDANGNPAVVSLRFSDDRGRTYGNPVAMSMGAPGQYLTWPVVKGNLGIARDRVFELSYSFNGEGPLNGAYVDADVLNS